MPLTRLRAALHLAALTLPFSMNTALAADGPAGGVFNAPGYLPAPADAGNSPRRTSDGIQSQRGLARPGDVPGQRATDERSEQDAVTRGASASPPKPSEFQKFVEAATGRQLPVFGASFFVDAASGFAPVDNVPVAEDYTVGPGDEVLIRAWGAIDVDYRTRVDRNGQVNLPKIGSFTVAGVKAADLERHLRAQIGRLYTNFNLNVSLGQLRGVKVFVVGPARVPGVYTVSSQSTLLSAVVAAGGPGPNGSMRKVLLRREGRIESELDMYEFLVQGDKSRDLQLLNGDVVVFQPAGPRIALNGALDNVGIYEMKSPQEPVSEVLRYAGGSPVLVNPNRVQLERIDTSRGSAARFVEEFKLDAQGLQKPLRDGDLLTLLPISPEFANAVTLKGSVALPLRHPHTPGMRIRDLIPDPQALISPEFYRRKNLLVQVLDADEADAALPGTRTANDNATVVAAERAKKTPAALFDELNWDYAVIERLNPQDLSSRLIPFNLGKAVLQGDPAHNLELTAGDVVTVYSHKDIPVPMARQTRLVTVVGEVATPGVYQLMPGETLPQLLARAGGFTPEAYVYGLDFSREDTRRAQRENMTAAISRLESAVATQNARTAANIGETSSAERAAAVSNATTQAQIARLSRVVPNGRVALELSPQTTSVTALPDVALEHGDRIVVPTRPGFVTVAGAVVNSNGLLWRPGRTAGDYLKVAGVEEGSDVSQMFILRADGTVAHAGDRSRFLGFGGLQSEPLYPGDAIVVPNQLDYETWGRALVRNLKDFSQIFYQFGLGAAAIKTLRD